VVKVSLPKTEKDRLQKLLADEKNPKQARRFQAILLADELSREKVAELLNVTVRTVENFVRFYKENGIEGLYIKKQSGRPRSISKKKEEKIISILESNPHGWSTKKIRHTIHNVAGVLYCKSHVYRIAQRWGFAQVTPRPSSIRMSKTAVYQFKKKRRK
jgi:transposase